MAIVNHLPCSAMVGDPFADYLNVSVPLDSAGGLRDDLLSLLAEVGSFEESSLQPGIFRHLQPCVRSGKIATESLGSVRFSRRGKVQVVSTSGEYFAFSGRMGGSLTTSRSSAPSPIA